MLKMTIDNEEVVSKNNFTIKEEMLSPSSTILNNTYPKTWEGDKNYTSRFYYPKDYAKLDIQNFSITPEEAGTTIDINGSATLTDVDTTKESRVLSLKGQTSQVTYSGKNKFDNTTQPIYYSVGGSSGWVITPLQTGIRVLNKTTSGTSMFVLFKGMDLSSYVGHTIRCKLNYSISGQRTGNYIIGLCNESGSVRQAQTSTGGQPSGTLISFEIPQITNDAKYLALWLYSNVKSGATENDYIDYTDLIITIDNSDMTYEQYVGGTASPNPSYPQPVNVVSGDNEINICGKNLLNTNLMTEFTPTQVTWYSLDGVNSFYSVSTIAKSNIYYDVKANKTYTFSVNEYKNINTSVTSPIQLVRGDTAGVVCSLTSSSSFEPTSFTPTEDLRVYPRISVATANVATQCTVQLEAGSTATTYEPHIGHSYPIYLGGTNLFSSDLEQGSLNSSGEITSSTTRIRSKDFISVKNSTQYTLSGVSSSTIQAIIYEYNNDTYTEQTSSSWNTLPYTFTTNATTNKIKVVIRYSSNGTITPTEVSNIQLENGSVATKYNHYLTTPIELCKIGTYQDYIYKDNGTWYLHKEIGKVVLDGSETWTFTSNGNAWYISGWGSSNNALVPANNDTLSNSISNYFVNITRNQVSSAINGFGIASSSALNIKHEDYATSSSQLSDFTTWLSANKPSIYYILETPTTTEITDTTLLEQLDDLESQ